VPFRVRKGYNCQTGTPPCGADIPLQEHDHERRDQESSTTSNALAKQWRKESIEEMEHADKLVDRIIFLDGFPNMQVSIRCTSAKP
jgi:Ferritin-like domain